ncbi:hypothetical protein BJV77DRAFT_1069812 [Russula vinacea]|nr:hypothetical protein BJV77DRAFT_1069812 [Russula vinacea]
MISDSHALSSHSPTPSIPAYTSTRAYAFDTHAYALDTPTLDTARTRSNPAYASMPPPSTPRIRFKTLTYTYQCPRPQHPRIPFNTHVHAFNTHVHAFNTHAHTRSHAQARCLASLALDTYASMRAGAGGMEK